MCLMLALAGRSAGDVAAPDASCAPASAPPSIHRRSIAITGGAFGEGTMDRYSGTIILRVHGSAYQMGFQHGAMLKDAIGERIAAAGGRGAINAARALLTYYRLPASAQQEIQGIAGGAGVTVAEVTALDTAKTATREGGVGRPADGEEPAPDWMVVFYHPADGQKYAAIGRPGAIGVLAGIRESCCLAAAAGAEPEATRRSVSMGLCGQDPAEVIKTCDASISTNSGEITVRLDADAGLLCLSPDAGKTWAAVDMATEIWRPECGACGKE